MRSETVTPAPSRSCGKVALRGPEPGRPRKRGSAPRLLLKQLGDVYRAYPRFLFSAKLRQAAQDPESKPALEGQYSDRDSMNKSIKENWTTGDISGFGFAFSLVLLGTIVSAYSDHPVFWLLVGPGPLVVGLTLIAFLRHLFTMHRRLHGSQQGGVESDH